MKRIIAFIFILFCFISYSQHYDKAYKDLQTKIEKEDVKENVLEDFLKKYEKELEKHLSDRGHLKNRLGVMAYERQYYGDAQQYYVGAFKDLYADGDTIGWAFAQYNLAYLYNHVGYYPQAEQMFVQALPIMARVYGQSSMDYSKMYRVLVEMYVEMGRYKDAKPMNDALLYYFKTLSGEKDREYLICLNTDAQIAQGLGDYKKAIEIFTSLVQIHGSRVPIDSADYITTLNNTAEAYRQVGEYDKALDHLTRALRLSNKFSKAEKISTATIYNNSGLCYKAMGSYQRAEICYDSCMYLYRALELTQNPDYTNSLNNKAEMYRILGRYQQAADLLTEVISIRKATTGIDHYTYANALTNTALLYNDMYRYKEAEEFLLEAEKIYKKSLGEDHQYYANCLHNLSVLYAHLKRYKEAEDYSNKAIIAIKKAVGEEHERYAYFLSGTATLYKETKNYDKAIANLQLSNAIIKKKFGEKHTAYIDGIYNLAVFEWLKKDFKRSKELFYDCLSSYKKQFDNFFYSMSDREQFSFYSIVGNRFEDFNTFVYDYIAQFPKEDHTELLNTCFNYQLFLKSLLLNNNVSSRRQILESKDASLVDLYNKWVNSKQVLASHYRDANTNENQWAISDMEIEADKLEQQLKTRTTLFAQAKPVTVNEIKAGLQNNEAAINILCAQKPGDTLNEYSAFIIKKNLNAPIFIKLDGSKKFESKYAKEYSDNIENKSADKLSYDRFWKQINSHLQGINKVYISTEGVYNQVNLFTLQNPATGKYVLDEMAISILPNLSYLLNDNNSNPSKTADLYGFPDYEFNFVKGKKVTTPQPKTFEPSVLLASNSRFGFSELPPLPGTKTEIENISSSLQKAGWSFNSYLKENASEEQLKKTNSPKVLHIATHGFFLKNVMNNEDETILGFESNKLKENPLLRSGIMMAGASVVARDTANTSFDQDGIFTAYEASLLNLTNTDLVILSACETGLGVTINNQGVFGLQRAFYIAGAKNLIMSLWVVDDDATQILMSEFYKEWSLNPDKKNISKAFKKAQSEVRKKYPHPYYWGAFTLLGN